MTEIGVPSMPPVPPMPPNDPSPTPTPTKKPRTNLVVIGSAVAVIAVIVATGVVVVQSRTDDSRPAATAEPSAHDEDAVTAKPDPEQTFSEVDADSFTIGLKTTARQCFGSAGCNVTVEPDLTFLGDSTGIDPNAVYDITYEIHGDESGPVIETAELSDRTSLSYTSSVISTASAGTEVSAEITDVSLQGG